MNSSLADLDAASHTLNATVSRPDDRGTAGFTCCSEESRGFAGQNAGESQVGVT